MLATNRGKKVNACLIYTLLWCLYSLQGTLYNSGGIVSKLLLLILLLWSLYSCYLVNTQNRKQSLPYFIKAVNVFLIMATVYGGILMISGQTLYITEGEYKAVAKFQYLKDIYMSLLPLYAFYYYAQRGKLNINQIFFLLLLFIGIAWSRYFRSNADNLAMAMAMGSTREEFTSNAGYSFLAIMPLLLFWDRKPLLQYLLLLVCIGGIILCMKRGAILIGAVCFVYFMYSTIKSTKGATRFVVVLLSILAIIGTFWIIQEMLSTSDYFVSRIEKTVKGDSSNRDILYANLWEVFINEPNPLKIIFGRGANATLTVGMNYAHNDWLELAINQGFLGIGIYIYYFIALFRDARRVRKINKVCSNVLLISWFILFSKTLFSMSYASVGIVQMLAIGLVLGLCSDKYLSTSKSLA